MSQPALGADAASLSLSAPALPAERQGAGPSRCLDKQGPRRE